MYNKVFLVGRLTKDPEQRYTSTGIAVSRFTLAVNREFKSKDGQKEADFLKIVAWRKLAEICSEFLKKGMLIAIEGKVQTETYTNKEGEQVNNIEIIADNMQMLERKQTSDADDAKEEVPF